MLEEKASLQSLFVSFWFHFRIVFRGHLINYEKQLQQNLISMLYIVYNNVNEVNAILVQVNV